MRKELLLLPVVIFALTGCSGQPMSKYVESVSNFETWNEFAEKVEDTDNLILGTSCNLNSIEKLCSSGSFGGKTEIAYTPVNVSFSYENGTIKSVTYFIDKEYLSFEDIKKSFDITGDPIDYEMDKNFKDGNMNIVELDDTITIFHQNGN